MKYCLSASQTKEYIQKADEIAIKWKDIDHIIDIMEVNPNLSYVVEINPEELEEKDWDTVAQYYTMTQKKLKVALSTSYFDECAKRNIPYFMSQSIENGWILNALIDKGVCAARITGELAHNLDYLNTLPIEIRVIPNTSDAPLGYKPLVGGWFRPEELYQLEAIDVCEFVVRDRHEEQALYRIYAEQHEWPGELNFIVKDIPDAETINRLIPPQFQQRRSNCKMRCQNGGDCHFCQTMLYFAKLATMRKIKEQLKDDRIT